MSKIGLSRFERLLAQQEAFAPDFQVLIAALSAHQESSETARTQTAIVQRKAGNICESSHMIGLFADGACGTTFPTPGSFSSLAATLLRSNE